MLEAMATGLPVVATLHGGHPKQPDGVNGLPVPERDHEMLGALCKLVENPAR